MRLTVQPRSDEPGSAPLSAVFQAPGGTLGRSADNHLVLPDNDRGICRIQAALRISDGACYLVNLSGMSRVSINGRAITRDQEVPLAPGDELAIGPYTLKAEDPDAPMATAPAAMAAAAATAAASAQAAPPEPDPLLESPLLEGADLAPPDTHTVHPASPPSYTAPEVSKTPDTYIEPTPAPPAQASDTLPASPAPDTRETAGNAPEPAQPLPEPPAAFPSAPARFDAPFADLDPPLAAEPQAPQSDPADVFSDLFGPGTLPVGSVPDVSAHPFDLESAQARNPEDPLSQLPRGDANVRGPLRDPLDMLGSPDADSADSVFSDQTPSTLPSHDPLDPHRSDPVTDTLTPRPRDDSAHAARDHLREYGGYMRPARARQPEEPDATGKPPRK